MVKTQIISETPITMAQLKEDIEKIKKQDKELNIRATKTLEYLEQFAKPKQAKELAEKLTKLDIPRLKEQYIAKIADVLPTTVKDLKVVLQGYNLTVSNENLKKIADTTSQFAPKK